MLFAPGWRAEASRGCRRPWPTWAASVLGVLLLLSSAGSVFAHAELEWAEPSPGSALPEAPPSLRLRFTEPLDGGFSRVQVLNAQRQQVDAGDSRVAPDDPQALVVSLPAALADGVYTVVWRTLSSVDGHSVNGAYPLIVGDVPEGAPISAASSEATFAAETAVGRWWLYVSVATLFGGLLAWLYVFSPLGAGIRAPGSAPARRAQGLALLAAGSLVLATLYAAVAQASSAADVPIWQAAGQPLIDLLSRGRFAQIWWSRLVLAVVALFVVAAFGTRRPIVWVALTAAAGAMLTASLTSHSAALASGAYLGIAVDWVHMLAASAWIGGLASMILVLPVTRQAAGAREERVLARAIRRFTMLALPSVLVIAATGTFQAWLHIGSFEALTTTGYGRDLLLKVALFLGMVGLGAFNFLRIERSLIRLAEQGSARFQQLGRFLGWTMRAEVALAVVILGATAVLTGIAPGRQDLAQQESGIESGGPVDREIDLGSGVRARVTISPAAVGQNAFTVTLTGVDPAVVERVQLSLTYLEANLGTQPLVLVHSADVANAWSASSTTVSQPGSWQAELLLRRRGQDDLRSAIRFAASGAGAPTQSTSPAFATYPLLPSPPIAAAYALVAAGIAVTLYGILRSGRRAWRDRGAMAAAGLVAVGCGGYVYAQEQRTGVPLDVVNVRNPIAPDADSIQAGQEIYLLRCAVCHGDTGRGDGPGALRLVPRPADLRVHMAAGHTDGQLFYWVSYGVPGTAMPAWKDDLTVEQRWNVINYIRTFADTGPSAPSPSPSPPPPPSPTAP